MLSDIEISNSATLKPIKTIAKKLSLKESDLEPYGKTKAKISRQTLNEHNNIKGKLILVTAITPTPAGEGKSTVSIGLADALSRLKKNVALCLREPSLGPCFGIKGGATGGGYSQVIPMDEINLNFTGDIHAVTTANNLLAALIDNHIKHGNSLHIKNIFFKRCLDLNDRALREIEIGLGPKINGVPRKDGFNISVASEIMAILCLAKDLKDLKKRLGDIVIGDNDKGLPIFAKDLNASGAMAAVLKDATLPNLVQTLEHTPAFIHGGPFANIAHGTSSFIAANFALSLADFVVTEAGFGADLGAEKFFDIFAKSTNIAPSSVVIVATCRALKMHGGVIKEDLSKENLKALKVGFENLKAHIDMVKMFGYQPVIAINRFYSDTKKELNLLKQLCKDLNINAIISEGFAKGSKGCTDLAKAVLENLEQPQKIKYLYDNTLPLKEKIIKIATSVYRAKDVSFSKESLEALEKFTQWGYGNLPICVAKTQNSISHDKTLLGAPKDYTFPITEVRLSAGAGFVVVLSGEINTMPGLPAHPSAFDIDITDEGNILGLF